MREDVDDIGHMLDDDPAAPWVCDPMYGGLSPVAARRSWEAAQPRQDHLELPPADDVPPPAGPEDYDLAPADTSSQAPLAPLHIVSAADWPDEAPAPVAFLVRDKIPLGDVSTLDGDGGLGKTMAALQLGAAVAGDRPDWFGMEIVQRGPVLFLSAEEPEAEIRRRAYSIARKGEGLSALHDLRFWFPGDVGDCLMATLTTGIQVQATSLFSALRSEIIDTRPVLVVVDNVAAIYGGDQNNRGQVRAFMNLWRGLARASGAAILLLNHPSLNGLTAGTGRGGSMDWRNAVRSALHLKPAPEKADADCGVRVLECVKSNYAPIGDPVRLVWTDGLLVPEGTEPAHVRAAQGQETEQKFLDLLDYFTKLGIDASPNSGRNYAPTLFEKSEHAGGFKRRVLAGAMERLLAAGKIKVETSGPKSRQKKILVKASQ